MMTAVLAQAYALVVYIVARAGNGGGLADILFIPEQLEEEAEGENADPQHQIHHPPPGANKQPPETSMSLLPVLGFGFCDGIATGVLLMDSHFYVSASAVRAMHTGSVRLRGLFSGVYLAAAMSAECSLIFDFFSAMFAIHSRTSFLYVLWDVTFPQKYVPREGKVTT
jgi:hypothetical protein